MSRRQTDINHGITKLPTFMEGFDSISDGGIPEGRVTLVAGTAGSGKTIFAIQFLIEGLRQAGEPAVFVTFEESADDIRRNMVTFGWDIPAMEREGRWMFVDGTYQPPDDGTIVGSYDLGGLLAQIEHAVTKVGAKRVSIDSFSAVLSQFPNLGTMRRELFRVTARLKALGATTVITAERSDDFGPISNSGVEEFVADNVIVLRNVLDEERRRRTVEILKFRGAGHHRGEFPVTILPDTGLIAVPLSATGLGQRSSGTRVTSGVKELDEMCGGGFFRDSVILVSGATGTGKSLLGAQFIKGGFERGEKTLLIAFEESRDQLGRNANGWGIDLTEMEQQGKLLVVCQYPEVAGAGEHLVRIKHLVKEFRPDRVVVDSVSAVERVTNSKGFREFVLGLASFVKDNEIATLITATTQGLLGGASITNSNLSTVTDTVVLLRYLERRGQVERALTVLKMRGSMHDKHIREFQIDGSGIHIGEPLVEMSGILAGSPGWSVNDAREG